MNLGGSNMINIFKQKLFYRYLLSYFVAFIIPFIILGVLIYVNFIADLQKELEQSSLNNLNQFSELMDERKKEFTNIATRISNDSRLNAYHLNHPYYGYEAVQELAKYRANSVLVDEIAIIHHQNPDKIFTSGGYHMPTTFIGRYNIENLSRDELIDFISQEHPQTKVIETGDDLQYLAFIQPIVPNSLYPYGAIMYMVNNQQFDSIIRNALSELSGHIYVLNDQLDILVSHENDPNLSKEHLDFEMILERATAGEDIDIEGKKYSVSLVQSDDEWSYLSIVQAKQFLDYFKGTLTTYLLVLLAVFFIGIIMTYILSKYQYKPIDLLLRKVKQTQASVKTDQVNELNQVLVAFDQLNQDKVSLSETVFKQRPFAKQQFWMNMLKGDYPDESLMNDMARSLQLQIDKAFYFVFIIHFKGKQVQPSTNQLMSEITFNEMIGYGIDLLNINDKAMIVGMDQKHKSDQSTFIDYVNETLKTESIIVVGSMVEGVRNIHDSYIEAMVAYDYIHYHSEGSTIFFDSITTPTEQSLGYLKEEQLKLLQALKQGQTIIAKETLAEIFQNLRVRDRSLNALKAICFDVINSVVRSLSEMGVCLREETFSKMVDFVTLDQLEQQLDLIIETTCASIQEKMQNENNRIVQEIINYVNKHFTDYDLSLEQIAEKHHLSASYASKLIKEHYGVSFKHYVQELRMTYVKENLRMTSKPIKAIVHEVGYMDVANFTRKFKKEVGVTPGQYRNLNK